MLFNVSKSVCLTRFPRVSRGNTALHVAVITGNNESYRYLKMLGALDFETGRRMIDAEPPRNGDGRTVAQLAAELGTLAMQAISRPKWR